MSDFSELRHDNHADQINIDEFDADPIKQADQWIEDAIREGYYQANSIALSTVSFDGRPSCRIVLLKELNENGWLFYTNYDSRKGQEIAQNPYASGLMYWDKLERQIRFEGKIEKVNAAKSDEYFASRPRDSQLGAAASPQSQVIGHRLELAQKFDELDEQYKDQDIPRPDHWGGYLFKPSKIEFWQGRPSRLHDRLLYTQKDGQWVQSRLAP